MAQWLHLLYGATTYPLSNIEAYPRHKHAILADGTYEVAFSRGLQLSLCLGEGAGREGREFGIICKVWLSITEVYEPEFLCHEVDHQCINGSLTED